MKDVRVTPIVLGTCLIAALAMPVEAGPREDILATLEKVSQNFTAGMPKPECGWTRGTFWAGNMAHYYASGNESLKAAAKAWGDEFKWQTCNYPNTIHEHSAANDYLDTQTFAELYALDQNTTFISISEKVLQELVQRPQVDDYWWIDAFFMGLPSFAALYNVTGDESYTDKMYLLFNDTCVNRTMWDDQESLFYRDQSYIGKTTPHGQKVFWSRGNGWAMAGLTRISRWIKPDDPHREEYLDKLRQMATVLRGHQGEDGNWRTSLLDPLECPGPETTGTALFTFAFAALVNDGVLDESFRQVAVRAWNGLMKYAIHDNGYVGYCQEAAGGPGNASMWDTSDFCVGQVLLAGSEVAKFYS